MKKLFPSLVAVKKIVSAVPSSNFAQPDLEKLARLILNLGGLINPIIVRRTGMDSYEIVDGNFEALSVVGYAVMMFYFDWRLALFSVTSAPLVVYPLVRLGQRVRRSTRRSQEQLEHLSHLTAEAFTGHRIVKAFAAERHEGARSARPPRGCTAPT